MKALDRLGDALNDIGWVTRRLDDTVSLLRVHAPDVPEFGESVTTRLGPDEEPWFYSSTGSPIAPCTDIHTAAVKIAALLAPFTPTLPPGSGKTDTVLQVRCTLKQPPFDASPLDALREALRRRAPHITVRGVHTSDDDGDVEKYLTVTYAASGERRIVWSPALDGVYRWDTGPDTGTVIRADADRAAEHIAWALGAPIRPA